MAKGVRGVTRPVVLRPETDVAVLVLSLMVIAKGIASSFSRLRVEPATRKYSACRFDTHHRRASTSILDRISTLKTGFDPVVDVAFARNVVVRRRHEADGSLHPSSRDVSAR